MAKPYQQIPSPRVRDAQLTHILTAIKHNLDTLLGTLGDQHRALTQNDIASGLVLTKASLTQLAKIAAGIPDTVLTDADLASGRLMGEQDRENLDEEIDAINQHLDNLGAITRANLADSDDITLAFDAVTSEVKADLKPTGVTAGNYGDGTNVPTLTVDANGRITAAGQVTVAAAAPLVVNDGEVSTIPANRQMLWTDPIELVGSGSLEIDGALEEVA